MKHLLTMINTAKIARLYAAFIAIVIILLPTISWSSEFRIGVRAHNGIPQAIKKWQPTVDHLNLNIPAHKFKLVPIVNLKEITIAASKGQIDFVLTNPSSYAELNLLYGASRMLTLLNKRQHTSQNQFGSVIFTLTDQNDINTIQDLRGKTLSAVSPGAFGGWTVALREIRKQGIDPEKDLDAMLFSGGLQQDVVFNVLNGLSDAGVVRTDQLERMAAKGQIDLKHIKIVSPKKTPGFPFFHSTRLYPEWPFSRLGTVPDNVAQQVALTLMGIKPTDHAAIAGSYTGWTVPLNYQTVHDLMKELHIGPYKHHDQISVQNIIKEYKWTVLLFLTLLGLAILFAAYVMKINHKLNNTRNKLEAARDKLQNRISLSESREKTILDTVADGIITIDNTGVIISVNPAVEKMFTYPHSELKGKLLSELTATNESTFNNISLWETQPELRQSANNQTSIFAKRRDGTCFPIEANFKPLNTGGYAGILHDATERTRIDKMKNEFISTVSHELRTPLTSIRGALGLLNAKTVDALPTQARELLVIANNNTERLLLLINDILDIQKIESDAMAFQFSPHEIMPLVEKCVLENIGYAQQYKAKYNIKESVAGIRVNIDQDRLIQVLNNLLSNAAKFSPEEGEVEVRVTTSNGKVRVSIKDFGPGIPFSLQPKLFEKFTQSDSSDTRKVGGTGLGLSIAKAIIERHNGEIGFKSVEGEGTCFFFELNTLDSTTPHLTHTTALAEIVDQHVLVVEDDPDIASLLEIVLNQANCSCEFAHTPAEAWKLLNTETKNFDIITLDLMLPEESGEQFIQQLRETPRTANIPVIVISAKADIAKQELNGTAIEVIDWLQKPIDQNRLMQAIQLSKKNCNKQKRILHVEDEEDVHKIIKTTLTSESIEIAHASTLSQAVIQIKNNHFDTILLDIALPDGSGLSLLPLIKEQLPQATIIIFSAYDLSSEHADKVNAVLVKSKTNAFQLTEVIKNVQQRKA